MIFYPVVQNVLSTWIKYFIWLDKHFIRPDKILYTQIIRPYKSTSQGTPYSEQKVSDGLVHYIEF